MADRMMTMHPPPPPRGRQIKVFHQSISPPPSRPPCSSSSLLPRGQRQTHTHRTLFVASGRCGSTRWSADDPFGLGDSPICPGQAHPKLDEVEGSKLSEGRCRERERVAC